MKSPFPVHCLICGADEMEHRFDLEEMISRRGYQINRCRRCGYVFNRALVAGEIDPRSLYSEDYYTIFYDEYFHSTSPDRYKEDKKFPIYQKALDRVEKVVPPGHLLEIGCGMGFFLDYARSRGWKVQGVEISAFAARRAREVYDLEVFCGELREAKIQSDRFDAVAILDVVEHVPDPIAFLEEVVRILKPGGHLLLITDNDTNFITRLSSFLYRVTLGKMRYPCSRAYPIFNVSYFSESLLRRILEHFGFEIEYSKKIDQPVAKTKLSGKAERLILRVLYAVNWLLHSQYQIFLVCRNDKSGLIDGQVVKHRFETAGR